MLGNGIGLYGKEKNLCFNLQPSISRDSILTIDDFESADNQSDKATDKDDDSLETANEEVGQQILMQFKDVDTFTFSKASLKEKDRQDKKDPVRDWMCSIKIEWLCQAGIN